MKFITGIFILILFISACQYVDNQKGTDSLSARDHIKDTLNIPIIEFEETGHDFGRVYEGEQVGWFFTFKNSGSRDLLITNAHSSCGCTVPDYSKTPVHPGAQGVVKVIFDSKGRNGRQSKTITIESNARNKLVTLTVTAEIFNK